MLAFDFQLLGNFRVVYEEEPWTAVSSPRLQELLAYLLLYREVPVPRSRLAATFWPDSTDAQARTNLRNLIYTLHAALPEACECLQVNAQTVRWNPTVDYRLDVAEFEAAMDANHLPALEQGLAFYAGDLLPDIYEDWVLAERERLGQLYETMLERIVTIQAEIGALNDAILTAKRMLQRDPLHEEHTLRLMQLHALDGDRVGIRRAYDALVTRLQEELDLEPSSHLQAAFDEWWHEADSPREIISPDLREIPAPIRNEPVRRLPAQLTSFVGRRREVAEVVALFSRPSVRVVTLIGAGGVGKTRLGLQAASELADNFRHGAVFVPLETVTADDLVLPQIVETLAISAGSHQSAFDALQDHLAKRSFLLVLDNFEHVIGAGPRIASLLAVAPEVKALVTSREPLRIYGEWLLAVPEMELPPAAADSVSNVRSIESVELFLERGRTVRPDLELDEHNLAAVVDICRRLEGLPLSLELAAARLRYFTPHELLDNLHSRLNLLEDGPRNVPSRHRALRSLIDWSYELLSDSEKRIYACLCIFSGGWSQEAAAAVFDDVTPSAVTGILQSLLEKNLIRRTTDLLGNPRYTMLETIREHAAERFALQRHRERVVDRYVQYFLQLAIDAPDESSKWLTNFRVQLKLVADLDNFNRACEYFIAEERVNEMWTICLVMSSLWLSAEASATNVERARLALKSPDASDYTRVWCLFWLAREEILRDGEIDADFTDRSLTPVEQLALQQGHFRVLGLVYRLRGRAARRSGDWNAAAHHWQRCLEVAIISGDKHMEAAALNLLGVAAENQNDITAARDYLSRSFSLAESIGSDYAIEPAGALICLDNAAGGFEAMKARLVSVRSIVNHLPYDIDPQMWWHFLLLAGIYASAVGQFVTAVQINSQISRIANGYFWDRMFPEKHYAVSGLQSAQLALGDEDFAAAWTQGQTMTVEDAWELAAAVFEIELPAQNGI